MFFPVSDLLHHKSHLDLHLLGYGACQPCTTVQMQNDFDYAQQRMSFFCKDLLLKYKVFSFSVVFQLDSMESKKIQIICNPRSNFRPRTQNESKTASHFLRCDVNSQFEYPTIYVCDFFSFNHYDYPFVGLFSCIPNGLVNR